ncbi:oligoendopeptidase F [Olsenella sp. oral taxon 809 str. F0356]|uniref:oligoendopeptidase F n=1 Tax=Olsenella sp. oral taxon 809 TaxID=661086 RepID=UPI000231F26A|nr:oligoendopeptidase F [Olsenella sp. oral taxon 809]EHF02989.1 oligoendopeptidase F [Olsenella sp. oral taxon 809 str. F0356]
MAESYKSRADVPERYTWDTSGLFVGDEAADAAFEEVRALPAELESWKGRALESAEGLLAFLRLEDEVTIKVARLYEYAARKADEDTRVGRYQDMLARQRSLMASVDAAKSWFEPALLSLDEATLDAWCEECEGLGTYRRALDKIRALAKHVLTPELEALLAKAQEMAASPEVGFSMLNDADLRFADALDSKGEAHPITHGSYGTALISPDRTLRENAYKSVYGSYRGVRNTSAALLAAQMKQLEFFATARGYKNTLDASLAPTEVPRAVYESLIESVHRNAPAMHRYMALRARALGLEQARYWDVYVPIVKMPERRYSFEEACDFMLEALAPLGEDYLAVVRRAIDERWIDVYETPGKASGAYSSGGRGLTPLILLNFMGTLEDVFTLVHEMGHSLHTYLASKAQPTRYADYEMFVAEVSSTTNEMLLMRYLLDHAADDAERAYLLDDLCGKFKGTLYRQTMFAEFEMLANDASQAGEGVGAEANSRRYRALNELYYGPAVLTDEDIALEWSRIPHFYYDYYVYVYATSFAAAVALSDKILADGAPAVERYLGFLAGGSSKPPLELLAGAGVDMASGKAVDDALVRFGQVVDELDGLI